MKHPYCVAPKGKKNPKFCFYTAHVYGQSAITILTTAAIATTLGDVFQSRDPAWGNQVGPENPLWLPPYEVQDIDGKGKGLVANRSINREEIILEEHPTLVELSFHPEYIQKAQFETMRQRAFQHLPGDIQNEVLDLARSHPGKGLQDILATNTFVLPLNGITHTGLFRRIAVCT
jgi:hypothetical protein